MRLAALGLCGGMTFSGRGQQNRKLLICRLQKQVSLSSPRAGKIVQTGSRIMHLSWAWAFPFMDASDMGNVCVWYGVYINPLAHSFILYNSK